MFFYFSVFFEVGLPVFPDDAGRRLGALYQKDILPRGVSFHQVAVVSPNGEQLHVLDLHHVELFVPEALDRFVDMP